MRHPKVKKVTAIKWSEMDIINQKIVDEEIKKKEMKRRARTEKSKEQEELKELEAKEHEEREELKPDSTTDDKAATQLDSESSSDGDIAEIIGVKKGNVKSTPALLKTMTIVTRPCRKPISCIPLCPSLLMTTMSIIHPRIHPRFHLNLTLSVYPTLSTQMTLKTINYYPLSLPTKRTPEEKHC
jgi:hypothetical protein